MWTPNGLKTEITLVKVMGFKKPHRCKLSLGSPTLVNGDQTSVSLLFPFFSVALGEKAGIVLGKNPNYLRWFIQLRLLRSSSSDILKKISLA